MDYQYGWSKRLTRLIPGCASGARGCPHIQSASHGDKPHRAISLLRRFFSFCKYLFNSCKDLCRFPSACFNDLGTLTVSIEVVGDGHTSLVALPRVRLGSAAPVVATIIMMIIIVFFIVIVVIVNIIVKIVVTVIVCKKTYPPVWDQSWN